MISPEKYYSIFELPSKHMKKKMWKKIKKEISKPHSALIFTIPDKKSFFYGIAAAFILLFITTGIIGIVQDAIKLSQPSMIKIDAAYTTAIREFEEVIPDNRGKSGTNTHTAELNIIRTDQINKLNEEIGIIQYDSYKGDLSPIKQKRLRHLYSMKLQILQEMIENGEIEL